jgi:glutamate dehydrogenase (NAD(P)+)
MTNAQHMLWMMDEYEAITGHHAPGLITGKPVGLGGSLGRTEATGLGAVFCVREALKRLDLDVTQTTAALQGFGNVSQHAARKFTELGGTVLAVSSWDDEDKKPYTFMRKDGVDVDQLVEISDRFGAIDKHKARDLGYEVLPDTAWLEQEVDILIPAALENQITADNVDTIKPTVKLVAEGANGPTTPEADRALRERGVFAIPDLMCNAGGVTCSYFEQVQSNANFYWTDETVNQRLDRIMTDAFNAVADLAEQTQTSARDAALMIAIDRVATACRLRGWI